MALQNQEILQCQVPKCFPGYCFLPGKVEASKLHPHTATSGQSKKILLLNFFWKTLCKLCST